MSGSGGRGSKGPNRARRPGKPGGRPANRPAPKAVTRRGPQPLNGPPVVGKRPSNPGLLLAIGLMWFSVAIGALFLLHRSWRLIPVICFAGVGILYLRGAAGSYLRRPGGDPRPKR